MATTKSPKRYQHSAGLGGTTTTQKAPSSQPRQAVPTSNPLYLQSEGYYPIDGLMYEQVR